MIEIILLVATILLGMLVMIASNIERVLRELKESMNDPCRERVCFWRIINTGYYVSDCGVKRHTEMGPTAHCSRCGGRVVVDGTEGSNA